MRHVRMRRHGGGKPTSLEASVEAGGGESYRHRGHPRSRQGQQVASIGMNFAGPEMLILLLWVIVPAVLLYFVVRLAVRHAIRDARRDQT